MLKSTDRLSASWSYLSTFQELSPHALYMRLKRICSKTAAGKLNVEQGVHDQWISGNRDQLLLALVRSMKMCGFDNSHRTRIQVRAGLSKALNNLNLIQADVVICDLAVLIITIAC